MDRCKRINLWREGDWTSGRGATQRRLGGNLMAILGATMLRAFSAIRATLYLGGITMAGTVRRTLSLNYVRVRKWSSAVGAVHLVTWCNATSTLQ